MQLRDVDAGARQQAVELRHHTGLVAVQVHQPRRRSTRTDRQGRQIHAAIDRAQHQVVAQLFRYLDAQVALRLDG